MVEYGPLIYSVLNRFPGLGNDRDDAFQEVCLIIHRSLDRLRDPDKLAVWIYGITYRHATDMIRRQRRRATDGLTDDDSRLVSAQATPEDELEELQTTALLLDLISQLRDRCQRLLRALYLEDPPLTYEQLHEREGIPIGSIGPTRARCLNELRELVEDVSRTQSGPTT